MTKNGDSPCGRIGAKFSRINKTETTDVNTHFMISSIKTIAAGFIGQKREFSSHEILRRHKKKSISYFCCRLRRELTLHPSNYNIWICNCIK